MEKLMSLARLRRSRLIFPLLLILTLLWGCRETPLHRTLLQAESVMEANPDSAYALLAPLQVDSTAPEGDRALHALLLTQAMHKTHLLKYGSAPAVIREADSMIYVALDYFTRHTDPRRLMLAYHYEGVVESLDSIYFTRAIEPLSRSIEISLAEDDPLWTARGYDVMGDIFYSGGAYHDMTEVLKKALEYYRMAGNHELARQTALGVAEGYINEGLCEQAIEATDSIIEYTSVEEDKEIWKGAADVRTRAYYFSGNYDRCRETISMVDSLGLHQPDLTFFMIASHLHLGDKASAREYMDGHEEDLTADDRKIIENIRKGLSGIPEEQLSVMKELYDTLASDFNRNTSQDFNTVQLSINRNANQRHAMEISHVRNRETVLCCILLTILIVVSLLFYIVRLRMKARHREKILRAERIIYHLEEAIGHLRQQRDEADSGHDTLLASRDEEIDKMKGELRVNALRMLRQKHEELNGLIRHYYAHGDSKEKADKEVLDKITRDIRSYTPTKSHLRNLEESVDRAYGGIMGSLREDIPGLKETYHTVAIYTLLGFDVNAIAYLTGARNGKSVTNILYRLRQRILALPEGKRKKYTFLLTEGTNQGD